MRLSFSLTAGPTKLLGAFVQEDVECGDPAIPHDDHVATGIDRSFAARTRSPRKPSRIVKNLGLPVRCVDKVRVRRSQVAGKLVDRLTAEDGSGWYVEDGVLCPELIDRAAASSSSRMRSVDSVC